MSTPSPAVGGYLNDAQVDEVHVLVDWVVEQGSALHLYRVHAGSRAGVVGPLFTVRVHTVQTRGMDDSEALPWLALAAGAPDLAAWDAVFRLLTDTSTEASVEFTGWLTLGDLGPLALAAGLTLEEAAGLRAAGTWDTEALTTLAGLRGWRSPDLTRIAGN